MLVSINGIQLFWLFLVAASYTHVCVPPHLHSVALSASSLFDGAVVLQGDSFPIYVWLTSPYRSIFGGNPVYIIHLQALPQHNDKLTRGQGIQMRFLLRLQQIVQIRNHPSLTTAIGAVGLHGASDSPGAKRAQLDAQATVRCPCRPYSNARSPATR